ncbi:OLC1v1035850C1 [Oldenlandia corymbosa var. corymbosa]|uniref:OLC1v1035850C1 n=1 Tax=Oldenlandia corymbosa var. corymbosa TaxID=529605 RepID=A0AAV1CTY8_OLDCO|nr:OLC1v1035850C1 [Oldenlandia corymbosa var. corymbosa]
MSFSSLSSTHTPDDNLTRDTAALVPLTERSSTRIINLALPQELGDRLTHFVVLMMKNFGKPSLKEPALQEGRTSVVPGVEPRLEAILDEHEVSQSPFVEHICLCTKPNNFKLPEDIKKHREDTCPVTFLADYTAAMDLWGASRELMAKA